MSLMNCFFVFCREERPKLRKLFPSLPNSEIYRKLGELWHSLDDESREEYRKMAKTLNKVGGALFDLLILNVSTEVQRSKPGLCSR